MMIPTDVQQRLASANQSHVLRFFPQLDECGRKRLLDQLRSIDLAALPRLLSTYVTGNYVPPIPTRFEPANPMPNLPHTDEQKQLYARAQKRGEELLRSGRVAAFVVAGGQGTRLGYDGPKGEYVVTPIRNKSLFQVFSEQLLAYARRWGRSIPWYIMTSDTNDTATRAFFAKHGHFGLNPSDIFFFQQGMMPAFSMDGKLLLAEKSSLALSPGGNGDCYRSLARSGALADMRRRGIEHLSYFNVDNPIVHCIDPLFLGLHDLAGSDMSSKAIPKRSADERVGNFCIADGKLQVIEYSDIPSNIASAKNADGTLRFNSASIGIHAMRVEFIEKLNSGGEFQLPWHRARKKVPCIDDRGNLITPEKPNAVKLELFVFDVIPLARNPIIYTTRREEEFSPVKNVEGNDSPATCRRDQIRRFARWLEEAGVKIPRDSEGEVTAEIEISPLYATTADELNGKKPLPREIKPGEKVYLE